MKPTAAQSALIHVAESAASSAVLTLLIGIMQQLATHQVNIAELGTIFGSGFVACFGLVYKSVKADPNLPQAESDTANEAKSLAQQALDHVGAMWPILHGLNSAQKSATPVSPPINLSMPQITTAAAQSVPMVGTFVPQLPFAGTLPPRSWTDTALTQAITPQPPRG